MRAAKSGFQFQRRGINGAGRMDGGRGKRREGGRKGGSIVLRLREDSLLWGPADWCSPDHILLRVKERPPVNMSYWSELSKPPKHDRMREIIEKLDDADFERYKARTAAARARAEDHMKGPASYVRRMALFRMDLERVHARKRQQDPSLPADVWMADTQEELVDRLIPVLLIKLEHTKDRNSVDGRVSSDMFRRWSKVATSLAPHERRASWRPGWVGTQRR